MLHGKALSAAEIKEIIRTEYASENPPGETLLVGSIDQIPSWRGSGDNTWSDFKYGEFGYAAALGCTMVAVIASVMIVYLYGRVRESTA